jgi:hypothetical protein
MAQADAKLSLHTRCVDALFARTMGENPSTAALGGFDVAPPATTLFTTAQAMIVTGQPEYCPRQPPDLNSPEGVRAAGDWFRDEKARLEAYTRSQFVAIRKQHEALLAQHVRNEEILLTERLRNEEALALRAQEVNRELQYLATQTAALQQRARELGEWERSLKQQLDKLTRAQEEALAVRQSSADVEKNTAAQQASLAQLRAEAEQLAGRESAARTSFAAFEAELTERQQAWEKKQADITRRHAEMEQRSVAVERAEAAAQRRMAELEEWEDRLRHELEAQELQAARDRRELESLRARLRAQANGK